MSQKTTLRNHLCKAISSFKDRKKFLNLLKIFKFKKKEERFQRVNERLKRTSSSFWCWNKIRNSLLQSMKSSTYQDVEAIARITTKTFSSPMFFSSMLDTITSCNHTWNHYIRKCPILPTNWKPCPKNCLVWKRNLRFVALSVITLYLEKLVITWFCINTIMINIT